MKRALQKEVILTKNDAHGSLLDFFPKIVLKVTAHDEGLGTRRHSYPKKVCGYVHTGVVSERFQKRFHLFYRFDALFTQTKGKYFQCIELAPTSAVNC